MRSINQTAADAKNIHIYTTLDMHVCFVFVFLCLIYLFIFFLLSPLFAWCFSRFVFTLLCLLFAARAMRWVSPIVGNGFLTLLFSDYSFCIMPFICGACFNKKSLVSAVTRAHFYFLCLPCFVYRLSFSL